LGLTGYSFAKSDLGHLPTSAKDLPGVSTSDDHIDSKIPQIASEFQI
jgi:hypothetical protein